MSKSYMLKLTSAVVVNGHPAPAGAEVEVDDALARRLLDAGKAELATAADQADDDPALVEPASPAEPKAAGTKKPAQKDGEK